MNCKYKLGDAFLSISMWISLVAAMVIQALQNHWGWWLGVGFLCGVFLGGCILNSKERKREEIQAIRQQRQIALGVPPDEVAQ